MDDDLLPVNVMLSGRSYRIRIRPEEEAAVRRGVKEADDKIKELRRRYAGKDDQDFLAMCLLVYAADSATSSMPAGTAPADKDAFSGIIARIDKALAGD